MTSSLGDGGEPSGHGAADESDATRATRGAGGFGFALVIACAALWCAWRDLHPGLYGDGPLFVELWRNGIWVQAHFLLLPLAIACRWLFSPILALDRAQAIRGVSAASSVIAAGCIHRTGAQLAGAPAACAATLVLLFAPAFRFYAGAVEVHALAIACAAIASACVLRPAGTRTRARAILAAAAVLAASAHVTLLVAGLPLLCLHVDAERRAGRPMQWIDAARSAVWIGAALAAFLAFVIGVDRLGAPRAFSEYSAIEQYKKAMVAWNEKIPRPDLASLFVLEVLAPLGALPWLALPGVCVLLRRRPAFGCACAAWFLLLAAAALKVGAREGGAYVLPAGAALAWASALSIERLARARSLIAGACVALGCAGAALALRAWAIEHGLRERASAPVGPWDVSRAELGLREPDLAWDVAAALSSTTWWILALGAAAIAARALCRASTSASASLRSIAGTAVLAALALFSQICAYEAHRTRWPVLWRQELVDLTAQLKVRVSESDELVAYAPNVETKWTVEHFLDRPWLDLSELDGASDAAVDAWIRAAEARLDAARARGARSWISDDALAALLFDAARRPRAMELALRWLRERRVERLAPMLPYTAEYLRTVLPEKF